MFTQSKLKEINEEKIRIARHAHGDTDTENMCLLLVPGTGVSVPFPPVAVTYRD